MYEDNWWLGCVLQVNQDYKTVRINILIPSGPSQSYKYPVKERVILVTTDDIFLQKLIQESVTYG